MLSEFTITGDEAKKQGIKILTGEACNLSMRLLCELDERAYKRYENFTGLYTGKKSGQCFLTWDIIRDLIIISHLETCERIVEILDNRDKMPFENTKPVFYLAGTFREIENELNDKIYAHAFLDEHNAVKLTKGSYKIGRYYNCSSNPHIGINNIKAL